MFIAVNPSAADLTGGSALGYVLLPIGVLLFSGGLFMLRYMAASETNESMCSFPQWPRWWRCFRFVCGISS